jgi:hypothetical protein
VLYGRDDLFSLVERHVGRGMADDRRISSAHHGCPPVILASGGRGSGKTAALDEISGKYGNRAPKVKRDIAAPRYSDDDQGVPSGETPLTRLLRDLKFELELKVSGNGSRIRFPILDPALIAVATWQADWGDDTEITLGEASGLLVDKTEALARIAHRPAGDRWVQGWIADVLAGLGGASVPFPAGVFVQATVHAFVARALGAVRRSVPIKWHENFDRQAAGDGYEALVMLGRDHSAGGNLRAEAERRLVAAFLADLSAAYGGPSWWSARAASPLALLDNVTANPVGRRFLELVLDCRARPAADKDPLVVVGCVPENFQLNQRAGGEPAQWVDLTPLRQPNALAMLKGADHRRYSGDLDQLIVRVTGGLPLAVAVITAAVAREAPKPGSRKGAGPDPGPGTPRVDSTRLLDLPSAGPDGVSGPPVAAHLLGRLIPDKKWQARLAMLACALDADEAQELVETYLDGGHARAATVSEAEEYLRVNGWAPGAGYFVPDPFLRVLLHHQLLAEGSHPTSAEAHAVLRDRYGEGASPGMLGSSKPRRLYHSLARGDVADVTRRLRESFDRSAADDWLAVLVQVAAAPCGHRPDARRDIALGTDDDPGQDDIHRSITRLLHAAWYLHDPLVAPDADVIGQLVNELNLLAGRRGNRVFTDAAREWPKRLRSWQQDWKPAS